MTVLQTAVILCWATCAALFAAYAVSIAGEITYVTLADGRRQERSIPLLFRVLLPLAPNFFALARRPVFRQTVASADAMLVQGGFEGLISGEEFAALKIMMLWIVPDIWLRRAVARRHLSIQRSLPFVLDLLTLSVEAGLDFMSALRRCTERPAVDPLSEELLRVVRETQIGTPRRDALRALARRVAIPDVRSLVNALVQADELGVSVGAILRVQADQIRQRRFERAEKLANEAPVKLLGPLVLFIFPSVFLVLLGPILFRLAAKS